MSENNETTAPVADGQKRLNISLTGDRILAKRLKTADRTKTGILMPEASKREHIISRILLISPLYDESLKISVGDVIVTRAAGMPVPKTVVDHDGVIAYEIDEETVHICRASDIIAFYGKEEKSE